MQIQPNSVKLPAGAFPSQSEIATDKPGPDENKAGVVQEKFQDAVAGTFYRTM